MLELDGVRAIEKLSQRPIEAGMSSEKMARMRGVSQGKTRPDAPPSVILNKRVTEGTRSPLRRPVLNTETRS